VTLSVVIAFQLEPHQSTRPELLAGHFEGDVRYELEPLLRQYGRFTAPSVHIREVGAGGESS
jgi:hypothetical protein